tara:strand:- start:101 stop:295 length:195 start_codon:yes stop_codon:yes gene_type:complete
MEFLTKYKSRLFWHGYKVEIVHPADQNKKLKLKVTEIKAEPPLKKVFIDGFKMVLQKLFLNGTL